MKTTAFQQNNIQNSLGQDDRLISYRRFGLGQTQT